MNEAVVSTRRNSSMSFVELRLSPQACSAAFGPKAQAPKVPWAETQIWPAGSFALEGVLAQQRPDVFQAAQRSGTGLAAFLQGFAGGASGGGGHEPGDDGPVVGAEPRAPGAQTSLRDQARFLAQETYPDSHRQ